MAADDDADNVAVEPAEPPAARRKRRADRYLRTGLIVAAVFLPALSLVPLGSLWLWQNGYLFYWVVAALVISRRQLSVRTLAVPPSRAGS